MQGSGGHITLVQALWAVAAGLTAALVLLRMLGL
jgi:hypothetical protein